MFMQGKTYNKVVHTDLDEEEEVNQEKKITQKQWDASNDQTDGEEFQGHYVDPNGKEYRLSLKHRRNTQEKRRVTEVDPMEKETSLFCPWVRVKRGFKLKIVTALLALSMFMERYTFIVSVYKTKFFGYLLILFVILMNVLFQAIQSIIRKDKHKRMLHQMFELERTPEIGVVIITILGLLDMFYAFFLFWPANEISPWLVITLLQFFIPVNMFFGKCCTKLQYYRIHIMAALTVLVGIIVNMLILSDKDSEHLHPQYQKYAIYFLLSQVIDVISHSIKENVVRSQPLNQEKFNLKIAISQFILGVILTPVILAMSLSLDDFSEDDDPLKPYQNQGFGVFFKAYISEGFKCLFSVSDEDAKCKFSFLWIIAYVICLFVLQASLTTLMIHKKSLNARLVFSVMVPMSVVAFALGLPTVGANFDTFGFTIFDGFGLAITGLGVFLYNFYEEKPQKASIETF